ncbi:hypothetical protein OPT61_g4623 [Boeremia exigua]|uniref:Uncharacterized protein n=1 Tax=Boeremia exigua TaxID=749465 RepID=A0ACC2IDH1_9PLEO|nr:hypothetical protein OPT61_g4623 [Boeremia exigua]
MKTAYPSEDRRILSKCLVSPTQSQWRCESDSGVRLRKVASGDVIFSANYTRRRTAISCFNDKLLAFWRGRRYKSARGRVPRLFSQARHQTKTGCCDVSLTPEAFVSKKDIYLSESRRCCPESSSMPPARKTVPEPQVLNPIPIGTSPVLRPGTNAVVYHIPTAPPTEHGSPSTTTITLARYSAWTSGLHFHATHTEYLRLVKGAIFVELNGTTKLISALEGGEVARSTGKLAQEGLVVEVPQFAKHNWGRLEHYFSSIEDMKKGAQQERTLPEDWSEEVVVEEWTDPSDIDKALFFWNLNNIITPPSGVVLSSRQWVAASLLGNLWIDLQLFQVFWELDNWPVFLDFRKLPFGKNRGAWLRSKHVAEVAVSFLVVLVARLIGRVLGLRAVAQQRTPDALWEAYRKSS